MLTYTITSSDHCRRLESFLRTLLPSAALGYPRKLIKSGAVKLNATAASPDTFLYLGDTVTVKESSALTALLREDRPALDILYEDDLITIVNKPA
ncbi:MAG: RluA family pseudouridine synthase, partial [Verrucomicrobia bacterium]|nr:RluA family pseudouridine synthase [Deltaproteobacteria bacterium]